MSHNRRRMRKLDPLVRSALVTTIQDALHPNDHDDALGDTNTNTNNTNGNIRVSIQELEEELSLLREQLRIATEKEQFISQRSHAYQKLLDEQAYRIKQQQQQQQQQHEIEANMEDPLEEMEAGHTKRAGVAAAVRLGETESLMEKDDDNHNHNSNHNHNIPMTMENTSPPPPPPPPPPTRVEEQRLEKWEQHMAALESIRQVHVTILATMETIRRKMTTLEEQKRRLYKMYDHCTAILDADHDPNNNNNNNNINNVVDDNVVQQDGVADGGDHDIDADDHHHDHEELTATTTATTSISSNEFPNNHSFSNNNNSSSNNNNNSNNMNNNV